MMSKTPLEMERLADALPVQRNRSRWIVLRRRQRTCGKLKEFSTWASTLVLPRPWLKTRPRFLKLYAERVLPLLRSLDR